MSNFASQRKSRRVNKKFMKDASEKLLMTSHQKTRQGNIFLVNGKEIISYLYETAYYGITAHIRSSGFNEEESEISRAMKASGKKMFLKNPMSSKRGCSPRLVTAAVYLIHIAIEEWSTGTLLELNWRDYPTLQQFRSSHLDEWHDFWNCLQAYTPSSIGFPNPDIELPSYFGDGSSIYSKEKKDHSVMEVSPEDFYPVSSLSPAQIPKKCPH
ncbi:hypothetical protein K435DRAFT_804081 [Dendrothele bispora CBS 962.96]|uniref:Uncharacterized protein n=1 Tax=Dendrothele bispora (strain CBS 962.96) TaxID=1314807 RepID=A0A4S8LFE3_DENBC|nr:hypothetical protein K435DRAFT_804081 [Dendrothele bispora CBS 962.96]